MNKNKNAIIIKKVILTMISNVYAIFCACKFSTREVVTLIMAMAGMRDDPETIYKFGREEKTTIREFAKYFGFKVTEVSHYWQGQYSSHVWIWIHRTSAQIDKYYDIEEIKIKFILLITQLIGCSYCRHHYEQNIPSLIEYSRDVSMVDLFLAFHTFVNKNKNGNRKFIFSKDLIDQNFKHLYV